MRAAKKRPKRERCGFVGVLPIDKHNLFCAARTTLRDSQGRPRCKRHKEKP